MFPRCVSALRLQQPLELLVAGTRLPVGIRTALNVTEGLAWLALAYALWSNRGEVIQQPTH